MFAEMQVKKRHDPWSKVLGIASHRIQGQLDEAKEPYPSCSCNIGHTAELADVACTSTFAPITSADHQTGTIRRCMV